MRTLNEKNFDGDSKPFRHRQRAGGGVRPVCLGNEPKITPEFLTEPDSTRVRSRLRRLPPLPGASMQPIVAKYDADRWYSEVVTFVLFGTEVFLHVGNEPCA